MANPENKQFAAQLEQLKLQQQSIVVQMQQQQYLLNQSLSGSMSTSDMQSLWKNAQQIGHKFTPSPFFNGRLKNERSPSPLISEPLAPVVSELTASRLYGHGVCKWPGCDEVCRDRHTFDNHLNTAHQFNSENVKQAKVQHDVMRQLEMQYSKEKDRLEGMCRHLNLSEKELCAPDLLSSRLSALTDQPNLDQHQLDQHQLDQHQLDNQPLDHSYLNARPVTPVNSSLLNTPLKIETNLGVVHPVPIPSVIPTSLAALPLPFMSIFPPAPYSVPPTEPISPTLASHTSIDHTSGQPHIKRRLASDKCTVPISSEISRNAEFYQTTDVRPPFTYASLIRQAIIDSPDRQLTLNEVYQWFISTFAFFRKNQATWKVFTRILTFLETQKLCDEID